MGADEVVVRPLEPRDVPGAAALLAEAMDDDPAYAFLFPNAKERRRGLGDFFARNLRTHLPYRCTSILTTGGDVAATVTLRPPSGIPISLLTMLRRGLVPFAMAHGVSAVQRLFRLKSTYDLLEADMAESGDHWLVHMMAVTPSKQGHGLGSQLLDHVLAATADGAAHVPTLLTTHKERNVVFYQRAGFEVSHLREVTLAEGQAHSVWCMRRPADALPGHRRV